MVVIDLQNDGVAIFILEYMYFRHRTAGYFMTESLNYKLLVVVSVPVSI